MFASIRRYIAATGTEELMIGHARNGIMPLLQRESGFIDYYFVYSGDGELIAITVFETQVAAEKSNTIVAAYISESADNVYLKRIALLDGTVVVNARSSRSVPTYASIRRYIVAAGHERELIDHSRDGLLPQLEREPGFAAYYLVHTGEGEMIGISAYDTELASHDASEIASSYTAEHTASMMKRIETIQGRVMVHAQRGE